MHQLCYVRCGRCTCISYITYMLHHICSTHGAMRTHRASFRAMEYVSSYMQIIHDQAHSQSIQFIIIKYEWLYRDEAKLLRLRHMGTSQSITVFVLF